MLRPLLKELESMKEGPMSEAEIAQVLEAVLFLAEDPLATTDLAQLLEKRATEVEEELERLSASYEERESGLVLRKVAGGWRLSTHPSAAPYLERFVAEHQTPRLTQAALETLAIIAYRQPLSRAQVAEIRGVSSDSVIRTLVARGLVEEVGRDSGPGQAILYGTTVAFMERLGLASLAEMPSLPGFMPDTASVERMESGLGPAT